LPALDWAEALARAGAFDAACASAQGGANATGETRNDADSKAADAQASHWVGIGMIEETPEITRASALVRSLPKRRMSGPGMGSK
jgi:hypothetical protein